MEALELVAHPTLANFIEPAHAGFAGASLSLTIDIPAGREKEFADFNHYMEVKDVDTVLAWQGRTIEGNKIFLAGAGTKAFYGKVQPKVDQQYPREKNRHQLQMFNDVLPHIVSLGLGRDTTNEEMTFADLEKLEKARIARRWVGLRAVAFDGFPTLGDVYVEERQDPAMRKDLKPKQLRVANANIRTHVGSGGGSFAWSISLIANYAMDPESVKEELAALDISPEIAEEILRYADSRREAVEPTK